MAISAKIIADSKNQHGQRMTDKDRIDQMLEAINQIAYDEVDACLTQMENTGISVGGLDKIRHLLEQLLENKQ